MNTPASERLLQEIGAAVFHNQHQRFLDACRGLAEAEILEKHLKIARAIFEATMRFQCCLNEECLGIMVSALQQVSSELKRIKEVASRREAIHPKLL